MSRIKSDQELIDVAIAYARPFHEAKQPGYFDDHVMAVYREVCKHTHDFPTKIAALFHDLVEDTDCTLEMIQENFGYSIMWLVDTVTDEPGPNRKIRKIRTYHKIRRSQQSILIKLADRLDNLRRCMRDPQTRFGDMYAKEDYSFQCAIWSPGEWPQVWEEYIDMIAIISRKATADEIISRSA